MARLRFQIIALGVVTNLSLIGTVNADLGLYISEVNKAHLLRLKRVQDELKLTDDQTKAITIVQEAFKVASANASSRQMDENTFRHFRRYEAVGLTSQARDAYNLGLETFLEKLTPKQSERLTQIAFQFATRDNNPRIWANEDVQKGFRFRPEQKHAVKTTLADLEDDIRKLSKPVEYHAGPRSWHKRAVPTKSVDELCKDANDKITATFDNDQKDLLKTFGGGPVNCNDLFENYVWPRQLEDYPERQ